MMDRMDVMGKDLVNFVDLKATAAKKKVLDGGIKQMDVMEPSEEKLVIDALTSLVLLSYHFHVLIYLDFTIDFKGFSGLSLEYEIFRLYACKHWKLGKDISHSNNPRRFLLSKSY